MDGKGYSFRNSASGRLSDEYNIHCQTEDSSQGKVNKKVWGKADWDLGLTGREGASDSWLESSRRISSVSVSMALMPVVA